MHNIKSWYYCKYLSMASLNVITSLSISYLLTKLPGGAYYDCNGPLSGLQLLLVHDVNQHGPNKSCSFAAASFRDTNHVTSRQSYGHSLNPDKQQEQGSLWHH